MLGLTRSLLPFLIHLLFHVLHCSNSSQSPPDSHTSILNSKERRPKALCAHKCSVAGGKQSERRGFSQAARSHWPLLKSKIHKAFWDTLSRLMNDVAEGFSTFFQWNNLADRDRLWKGSELCWGYTNDILILCMCTLRPTVAKLLSSITGIYRDPASRKLG